MIVIIDYKMGNLFSVQSALHYLGVESVITSDPEIISRADKLILPGVGSFYEAMANLTGSRLSQVIRESVEEQKIPVLGICLGMQLLGLSSTEDGFSHGLGLIDSAVERFGDKASADCKIPHVGFNTVTITPGSKLFKGLDSRIDFYFTHSYRMAVNDKPYVTGTCFYGEGFIAAVEKGHICGTQFHPEKSQANGLIILKNFIESF